MGQQGIHITDDKKREIAQALCGDLKDESGVKMTATKIADHFGVYKKTVYRIRDDLMQAGLASMGKDAAPKPVDVHDADFWRKRALALEKDKGGRDRIISAFTRKRFIESATI